MALNITSFKDNLADIARPNRFMVQVNPPAGLGLTFTEEDKYLTRAAQLPGRRVGRIELGWFGMRSKIPGDGEFDDMTITFLNVEDFALRDGMNAWIDSIFSFQSGERIGDIDSMKGTILIEQYGSSGNTPVQTYQLEGVFPKNLDLITLSVDSENTPMEFSVTFNIDYWHAV